MNGHEQRPIRICNRSTGYLIFLNRSSSAYLLIRHINAMRAFFLTSSPEWTFFHSVLLKFHKLDV
ncbi:hypothetical protein I7I53_04644 [Histoplasma capsulatum var. duboisii H88]|uniref:Uncharacterized protein n=1 Tax=Ajellomyces capsulatus (strain H88) TaxID=544711 RepID=A0A8A1LQ89_AJEC8|nr:hypothetical protein I7I53_04644 [Histoplasma capsulatum var. duboisii H88]